MRNDVPEGWKVDRIGDVVDIALSNVDKKSKPDELPVKLCNYMDVYRNETITAGLDFMHATATTAQIDKFGLRRGDVMITKDSEDPTDIAVPSVVVDDFNEVVLCGYHLALLRPKQAVDGEYLAYALRSHSVNDQFVRRANGATRYGITSGVIQGAVVPLPPLAEQRKIAAILSSVDGAIQATEAVIAQRRRVKEGLLQELLTKGIGHTRFKKTAIGEIPETWEVKRLGAVLDGIIPGRSPSAKDKPANGQEWGVLKVSAVGHGVFNPDQNKALPPDYEIKSSHIVKGGDVLITRANTAALVAATCRVPSGDYQLMLCDKTLRLVPEPTLIESDFLLAALSQPRARSHFALAATGSSASMKNVSQACIRNFIIAVPNISEQRRITATLQSVRDSLAAEVCRQDQLRILKAGLLQDLLSGKKRIENLE